mmetsp:Transcript_31224/g.61137  ORF Transcript_31224/g.61137 Transcript_31224/m.61137 type:complete len:260 (-) Transcript_31224:659-1438(-)
MRGPRRLPLLPQLRGESPGAAAQARGHVRLCGFRRCKILQLAALKTRRLRLVLIRAWGCVDEGSLVEMIYLARALQLACVAPHLETVVDSAEGTDGSSDETATIRGPLEVLRSGVILSNAAFLPLVRVPEVHLSGERFEASEEEEASVGRPPNAVPACPSKLELLDAPLRQIQRRKGRHVALNNNEALPFRFPGHVLNRPLILEDESLGEGAVGVDKVRVALSVVRVSALVRYDGCLEKHVASRGVPVEVELFAFEHGA